MPSETRPINPHLTTAWLLLVLGAWAAIGVLRTKPVEALKGALNQREAISGQVDPNVAPWWELSQLPGIGETRARQIVEYRAQIRTMHGDPTLEVFRSPADLGKVKGIGDKTAQRATNWLKFSQR